MVKAELSKDGVEYQTVIVTKMSENVFQVVFVYYGKDKPGGVRTWTYKMKQGVTEQEAMKIILAMENTDGK